jgi:hypothetical protein
MKKIVTLLAIAFCLNTNAQIIITVAGNHAAGYTGDGGQAINAELNNPIGVAFDASGNMYIADQSNNRVRKVTPSGIITTYAGSGGTGAVGDGGQATAARLFSPAGLAFDAKGNLYISSGNVVRMVNTLGVITTVAGNGTQGYSGDGGLATDAMLGGPAGIAVDLQGNLYIANSNVSANVVRKVNTLGIITTFAGTGTWAYSGDGGQATAAALKNPYDVKIDALGNVYIADFQNGCIRKVNAAGIISTYAGNGTGGFSGDGGQATSAQLNDPIGLAIDAIGNVYISDYSMKVRMVNTLGIINTLAGANFSGGYSGDGGPATAAALFYPAGIALDNYGNLFIADQNNNVIREVGKCIPVAPNICMVEVDSLSQNNIIYWDKTAFSTADTFYVYRDTANYNYALIGKVPASSLSLFADTVRHLSVTDVNGGDPNSSSWRYKIAYGDTCGNGRSISPMSPWHQTVFMITNNSGNFSWNFYQIEGETIPVYQVQGYYFEVDSFSNGHYHIIQSLSSSSTAYHDTHYANYPNPTWRSTAFGFNCTPTSRLAGGNNNLSIRAKSHSNTSRMAQTTGLNNFSVNNLTVSPNPSAGYFMVETTSKEKQVIQLVDVNGKLVLSQFINGKTHIDATNLTDGVYNLTVISNKGVINKKLIIVK